MITFRIPRNMVELHMLQEDEAMYHNEQVWIATEEAVAKASEFGGCCTGKSPFAAGLIFKFHDAEQAALFKLKYL